uniref:Uncharacterized protein n=1 Tax=Lactuca sativa TaxID=4236 RepID=A0A9R1VK39_LACSA|nr:hypothetical protein LSAT_V11C500250350 [Lactuca sativa]
MVFYIQIFKEILIEDGDIWWKKRQTHMALSSNLKMVIRIRRIFQARQILQRSLLNGILTTAVDLPKGLCWRVRTEAFCDSSVIVKPLFISGLIS